MQEILKIDDPMSGRDDTPLGTAEWMTFPANARPEYRDGDLWLGRLDSGESIGYHNEGHALVVGGTRGGKGVSVVLPNALSWPGSLFVNDPKGENAMVAARRRADGSAFAQGMGQVTSLFDPYREASTEADSLDDLRTSFNPLDLIVEGDRYAMEIATRIAAALNPLRSGDNEFFDQAARSRCRSFILHVASSKAIPQARRNLMTVREYVQAGDLELRQLAELNAGPGDAIPSPMLLLARAMQRNMAFGGAVSRDGFALEEQLRSADRTLGSVLAVAQVNTEFIDDTEMQAVLRSSSFRFSALKTDPNGQSVFTVLPQRLMQTSHIGWFRMMVDLMLGEMETTRGLPASGHQVLMILDEFPALKRMAGIESAAAQIAGHGVKMMMVAQTLPQLKDIYRDNWETLIANASVKVFFGNDDHFTRDYVSKLMGNMEVGRTVRSKSLSESESRGLTFSESSSSTGSTSLGTSWGSGSGAGYSTTSTSGWSTGFTVSSSETRTRSVTHGLSEAIYTRALATPDEIGRIFGNVHHPRAIVLVSGHQPLSVRRSAYFEDDDFVARFNGHRDHPTPLPVTEALAARDRRWEQRRRELAMQEAMDRLRGEELERQRLEGMARDAAEAKAQARAASIRRFIDASIPVLAYLAAAAWIVWLWGPVIMRDVVVYHNLW